MRTPALKLDPEAVAKARWLYERTQTRVGDIAAFLGIGERTLYSKMRIWGWKRRGQPKRSPAARQAGETGETEAALAALERMVQGAAVKPDEGAKAETVRPPQGPALVARIRRAVERELEAVERALTRIDPAALEAGETERAARLLASLVKTLGEVQRLEQRSRDEDRHESHPAGRIDALRRALARRLDRLAGARAGGDPGSAER